MENQDKVLHFGESTLKKLKEIVNIKQVDDESKFDEWFAYKYKISEEEDKFLSNLLNKNKLLLASYSEQTLIAKFISPILNKIDFKTKNTNDWYKHRFVAEINGYELRGEPDYIVATGIEEPEIPYFFFQEFKHIETKILTKNQLLAGMLAGMQISNTKIFRGSFVIKRDWYFVILEKLKNNNYQYYISKQFDSLDIEDLRMIYIILQSVKFNYCK